MNSFAGENSEWDERRFAWFNEVNSNESTFALDVTDQGEYRASIYFRNNASVASLGADAHDVTLHLTIPRFVSGSAAVKAAICADNTFPRCVRTNPVISAPAGETLVVDIIEDSARLTRGDLSYPFEGKLSEGDIEIPLGCGNYSGTVEADCSGFFMFNFTMKRPWFSINTRGTGSAYDGQFITGGSAEIEAGFIAQSDPQGGKLSMGWMLPPGVEPSTMTVDLLEWDIATLTWKSQVEHEGKYFPETGTFSVVVPDDVSRNQLILLGNVRFIRDGNFACQSRWTEISSFASNDDVIVVDSEIFQVNAKC